jgi:DtxR family Mn-dependent transcriptional regulator
LELSATLEDYLEAIHRIEDEKRVARPKDISESRNVAASTVTAALQSLSEKGLINYEPHEFITLTDTGREEAERLAMRRHVLTDFLEDILDLPSEQARATACDMEHSVDRQSLERFVCLLAFMKRRSSEGSRWLEEFRRFMREGADGRSCRECVEEYIAAAGKREK